MIDLEVKPLWSEIKGLLVKLKEEDKLFCPLSQEHYLETSQKRKEDAIYHDDFLSSLSDGYSFKPELYITSQLISSRIRSNNITLKTYMYERVNNLFSKEEAYNLYNENSKTLKKLFKEATVNVNELRRVTYNQKIDSKTRSSLISLAIASRVNSFKDRLKDLIKQDNIIIRGDKIGSTEVPNWIDLIIHQLLKRHKFKRKEIKKLINELNNNGFSNIPTLNISTILLSYFSIYSKQERPNDHIDVMRISTGLPISDVLLTDKKRKSELIESGLHKKYKTKVFSGTNSDLKLLIKELKNI